MACVHPLFRKVKGSFVPIPCGYCMPCRVLKSQGLNFQLNSCLQDCYRNGGSAVFATLTYTENNLPYTNGFPLPRKSNCNRLPPAPALDVRSCPIQPTLCKRDAQLFLKRLRKSYFDSFGLKLKFVLCGEYGDKVSRPHYHLSIIGMSLPVANKLIRDAWTDSTGKPLGICQIGTLRAGGFNYITKYYTKSEMGFSACLSYDDNGLERPFVHHSTRLAYDFINSNSETISDNFCYVHKGKNIPLPTYLRRMLDIEKKYQPDRSSIINSMKKFSCTALELFDYKSALLNYELQLKAIKDGSPVFEAFKNLSAPKNPVRCNRDYISNLAVDALDPVPF